MEEHIELFSELNDIVSDSCCSNASRLHLSTHHI